MAAPVAHVEIVDHWIEGKASPGSGTRTADVYNPATGITQKRVRLATAADVDVAVQAAAEAFQGWANSSLARRAQVMFAFREQLNARKTELAAIITSEQGKVLADAIGEVTRGLETVEFACGMPNLLKGSMSENVSTGITVHSLRQPLGVTGIVSPFNFPAMVPLWFIPIAIAAGNTVVLKPSEKVPTAAVWIARLMQEAGLPEGVLNVVHGDKEAVDALLEHPDVASISFVGSTPTAKYVYETGAAHGKRVQALGGAKNHMLVLPDADLDLVADSAVGAGFGAAGERCMAISVIVAVESIADELVTKITDRIVALRTGDGMTGCDMGPLITAQHLRRVVRYLDIAAEDGIEIVVDGRIGQGNGAFQGDERGFFLMPTLLDNVTTNSRVYTDEIFDPVLSVVRVAGYADGIDLINSSAYGNGAAIFTNDGGAARRFEHEVQAGMVGINVPIPVPVSYYSFGGWKASLFGDSNA